MISILPRLLLIAVCLCLPARGAEQVLEDPFQSLRERAQRSFDEGDVDGGHQAMVELLAQIPGRVELTAELLGVMCRTSMADRRTDRWTEYAAERLVALHQAGLLDDGNTELPEAYESLVLVRWDQGRMPEAWETLQGRLGLVNSAEPGPMTATAETNEIGQTKSTRQRRGQVSSVESPRFDVVQSYLSQVTPGLARTRNTPWGRKKAVRKVQPGRTAVRTHVAAATAGEKWSNQVTQRPDNDPTFFDQHIRTAAGTEQQWDSSDSRGIMDLWRAVDLHLQELDEASMTALRQIQETQYQEQVRLLTPELRQGFRLLALYRASPWSATANTDLMALAQAELNRGFTVSALRSFLDIMNHSSDTATLQAAQVGAWLAAASEGTASGLDALFECVDPAARFPWMGKTETAANIKTRLQKGMPAEVREDAKLAELELRTLRLPAVPAWPTAIISLHPGASLVDLQVRGDRILAGARNWLAWYDVSALATSLWSVINRELAPQPDREAQLPGYWRPALVNGRLYTRAGKTSAPSQVHALDAESGRTIWATPDPETTAVPHGRKFVFNAIRADPAIAGGCVFYIELVRSRTNPGDSRLDVACVAADDGALLWRSTVVWADDDTVVGQQFRDSLNAGSMWENAPAVSDGAVYLDSTGIAARLDARDGRVEWVCANRGRSVPIKTMQGVAAPLGAPPLVVGEQVLITPRNGGTLFAVNSQTGKRMWEQMLVQPVEMLGVRNNFAVVRTVSELIAVAPGTGEIQWHVPSPTDIVGRCALRGDLIHLATGDGLLSINVEDGLLRERRAWPTNMSVLNFMIANKALVVVTDEPSPTPEYRPSPLLAAERPPDAKPLRLPLTNAWFLAREHAQVFAPPPASPLHGRIFLLADGALEAIDIGPQQGRSAWRRFSPGSVRQILFDKNTLVLCSDAAPRGPGVQVATAIDGHSGLTLWRLPVFPDSTDVMLADGVLLMRAHATEMRTYDVATGKLLWLRQGFQSPLTQRQEFMVFVEEEQLHLFGHQWKNGIPHLCVDMRTGTMLPLKWAVEGSDVLLGMKSQIGIGKKSAIIRVVDRSDGGNGRARVYRYSLAEGKAREIAGMDMVSVVSPPYTLVSQDGGARTLLSCDDPSYQYSLTHQGGADFSEGLILLSNNQKISVVDPATKKRICEIDQGRNHLSGPGIVRLDDARILLYGTYETVLELHEIDRQSGLVSGKASMPRFDPAGREQLQGRPLVVNNVMLFSSSAGVQALVSAGE